MKRGMRLLGGLFVLGIFFLCGTEARAAEEAIAARSAEVDGLKLHYLTAGHGPAVCSRRNLPSLRPIFPESVIRIFPKTAWI